VTMYEQFEGGFAANRFRSSADWFVRGKIGDVHTVRVGASGERAVDLMHALVASLPPHVHVSVESIREKAAWAGWDVSRNDTRDVLARIKLLLASYGGVEIAVYTHDDQLTLTPELEVVVYSRLERWGRRLIALGLEERDAMPASTWRPSRHALTPAPELSESLETSVKRLGLTRATLDIVGP
jgi:hypothetical protein